MTVRVWGTAGSTRSARTVTNLHGTLVRWSSCPKPSMVRRCTCSWCTPRSCSSHCRAHWPCSWWFLPRFSIRFGPLVVVLAWGAVGAALVAKETGEILSELVNKAPAGAHRIGDVMPYFRAGASRSHPAAMVCRPPRPPRDPGMLVALVTVVVVVATAYWTYRTGDSGAQLVWRGRAQPSSRIDASRRRNEASRAGSTLRGDVVVQTAVGFVVGASAGHSAVPPARSGKA